jgi:Ni/Co efflux regulator RcnB
MTKYALLIAVICMVGSLLSSQGLGQSSDYQDQKKSKSKKSERASKTSKATRATKAHKVSRKVINSKKSAKNKKTTINELLEEIDSRGSNLKIKKQPIDLPAAQVNSSANPQSLREVKPPKSNELMTEAETDEEKLESITDQGIEQLYKLTQQYTHSPRRGELWLRLAESYVEKSKYIEYRAQKIYDEKLKLYFSKKIQRPKLDLSASHDYNLKAVKLYEWFLRDFPKLIRLYFS